ncbi:response regulator [Sphingomonas hankyongi]|uniref:Response regulator n=1 Tax=Sphingomonas hankyongi TaxID=2908209 RepID=A0ABT0S391_9SPHN|nr:response regulator [Sphingomonas hankyongi]MCL6730322.1 response regulator [Sphingomonas hankyongi]
MANQTQQSECVLVIDGDVLVRHAIADYLRNCGYIVIEASTTDEARTVLNEVSLAVDAAICDAEAPGSLNAFEFRAWALRERPAVQIALAGNIETAAHKAAELCEEGPQLSKPYDPQGVISYIRRLLGNARSATVGGAA